MRDLKEITSIDDLIKFLETKGKNHKYYYHYTSWDSFEKIYNNRSFLLTKGNSLIINDQHEANMKGSWDIWNKTYIGSFAYGSSENMAMWGLYGLPWQDAIRITISKEKMLKWIQSINSIYLWEESSPSNVKISNIKKSLTDIVYIEGNSRENINLIHSSGRADIANNTEMRYLDKDSRMTGYIKNDAWNYEKEVRIKIELPQSYYCDKIQISIPEDTINSFTITTGPYFQEKEHQNEYLFMQLEKEGRINKSEFNGLVRYRELCSMCKYKHFTKIER